MPGFEPGTYGLRIRSSSVNSPGYPWTAIRTALGSLSVCEPERAPNRASFAIGRVLPDVGKEGSKGRMDFPRGGLHVVPARPLDELRIVGMRHMPEFARLTSIGYARVEEA